MTWGKLNYNYPKYLAILFSIIFFIVLSLPAYVYKFFIRA